MVTATSSASVLVPGSPHKAAALASSIDQRYQEQRQDAHYDSLTSRATPQAHQPVREPIVRPSQRQNGSFVSSSAQANRRSHTQASKQSAAASQKIKYVRNSDAGFDEKATNAPTKRTLASTADDVVQQRDDSLRLIEELTIGPKRIEAPEGDVHFKNLEPTSGVALRKRYIHHRDFEPHLEDRYYLSISTLHSVLLPGKSDDGDFILPITGDWLTMGVITARSDILMTKERALDGSCRSPGGRQGTEEDALQTMETKRQEAVKGAGQAKQFVAKKYFVVTLTDLSKRPNKYGEHDGSQEVEMSVFEADNTWLEAGGERKYAGGSFGAFEKLHSAGLGSLVCVMNPRLRTAKSHEGKAKMLRLNPRAGKTISIVGMAADYGSCSAGLCQTFVDKRTGMDVCTFHLNKNLDKTRNGRSEVQNSYRQTTTQSSQANNLYALSDGLSLGTRGKQFAFDAKDSQDPNDVSSRKFDVKAHFGRAKEQRVQENGKLKELIDLNRRLVAGSSTKQKGRGPAVATTADDDPDGELRLEMMLRKKHKEAKASQSISSGKGVLDVMAGETAASKVIEAARKALQEKKRRAQQEAELSSKGQKVKGGTGGVKRALEEAADGEVVLPDGSYRALNGDMKKLSESSSKLLARHSADTSKMPKPLLHRKKIKLTQSVKPPPGESFYASESSDSELDEIMRSDAVGEHLGERRGKPARAVDLARACSLSDSESDLEILPPHRA